MHIARFGVLLLGSMLVLAACGRVPPTANPAESPSAAPTASPTAAPEPLTISGPSLHTGEVALAYAPVAIRATGGNPPYLWILSKGALPDGLTISIDGAISGTPSAAGTFSFTVEVTDASLSAADLSGSITVVPRLTVYYVGEAALSGPPNGHISVCTGERLPCHPCPLGSRYEPFAAVSGGVGPYTYSLASGTLPPGTRLNGLALAGTFPTESRQSYAFTVAVTDSLGVTATISASYDMWFWQNFCPPSPASALDFVTSCLV